MMRQRAQYNEREAAEWTRTFRGSKRVWLLGLAGNALLLAVLLGGPYLRGQARARASWAAYDALCACTFPGAAPRSLADGESASAGEAAAYAGVVQAGGGAALARCLTPLQAVAPAPAFFLLPSLKGEEDLVREAVRVAEHELESVAVTLQPFARVPLRPLQAIEQLRLVLGQYGEAAGLEEAPPAPPRQHGAHAEVLPLPGRVPLYAGTDAVVTLWGDDAKLHALGLDRTGISYLELEDHFDRRARLVRPKLLRDILVEEQTLTLIWGMAPARCRDASCSSKATGLATMSPPLLSIPEPRWLAGHLAGRADRSLHVARDRVAMLADAGGSLAQLRSFPLVAQPAQPDGERMPPLQASSSTPVGERSGAELSETGRNAAVIGFSAKNGTTELVSHGTTGTRVLASLDGTGTPWVVTCSSIEGGGFLAANDRSWVLGTLEREPARLWHAAATSLEEVFHESDRSRDRVRLFCWERGLVAVFLDRTQRLAALDCASAADSCVPVTIAEQVSSFAAIAHEDGLTLAFVGDDEAPQLRVRTLSSSGILQGEQRAPSVCWAPHGGMCGHPTLAKLGARIVLGARDGTDLLALESADGAASWTPLHGANLDVPTQQFARSAARQRRTP